MKLRKANTPPGTGARLARLMAWDEAAVILAVVGHVLSKKVYGDGGRFGRIAAY
jgi:hypothetical protein